MTELLDNPSNSRTSRKIGDRSFLARFLLASSAAFVLVFLAAVAVGGRGFGLSSLVAPAAAPLALSLASGAASASLVRRSGVLLVLLAQGITVAAIGAWNFLA